MTSRALIKAGIYFSHYECFGHTSRVMAVGEVFKQRFPKGDLFFIQAGVPQPRARINELGRVYSLPEAFMDRRHFKEPIRGAGVNTDERGGICGKIVGRERPDLFITEFFPLGREECRHELIPSLIKASRQGSALWAVAGYPLLTGADDQWREKIFKLYQKIIIFSPPVEEKYIAEAIPLAGQRRKYLEFFKRHAKKIVFAGYLLPRQEVVRGDEADLHKPPVPRGACRVAVLRGGGAVYPKVIAQAIRASDILGTEYYLTVVAGPSTTAKEWAFFRALAGKKKVNNLALHRAVGHYEGLIKSSDVCVSLASYHTSLMLLKHRKKAVLVPFEGYGSKSVHEQPARSVMLKETIGARILSIQDMTANALAKVIKETAASGQVSAPVPEKWFMGAKVLDKALTGLFGR
jgi:predicted glycosyltransferase